uniref:cyclin-dependent kinase n=1 Tax=Trypanosoma congolense (strain IL3000) TaxID=1068625 RepID=G0USD3_TRYCI|nr:putative cell division control protein 2 homolog 4 [Trypanosoma congolense IL3000]
MSTVNRLQCIGKLGEGTYGVVYKARELATGQVVAYKRITVVSEDDGAPSTAVREIALLKMLKHNNIVRLYDVLFEPPKLTLIFEYCEYDLRRFMHKYASIVCLQIKGILKQILLGLEYMHRRHVVHRDLKPDNVFVRVDHMQPTHESRASTTGCGAEPEAGRLPTDAQRGDKCLVSTHRRSSHLGGKSDNCDPPARGTGGADPPASANPLVDASSSLHIKLGDYGMARIENIPVKKYSHDVASLWYRSPDALLGSSMYGFTVDLWSVGCIFAEAVTGTPLIRGTTDVDQLVRTFKLLGTPTPETWPSMKNYPKAAQLIKAASDFAKTSSTVSGRKKSLPTAQQQQGGNLTTNQKAEGGISSLTTASCGKADRDGSDVVNLRSDLYSFPPHLRFPSTFDEYVQTSGFHNCVGDEGTNLLRRLICYEPSHRLTAQEALAHPFLSHAAVPLQRPLDVMTAMLRQSLREHGISQ